MSKEDYDKAYRSGKRNYQIRLMLGQHPTLQVLDDILPSNKSLAIEPLGLVQIPIDQIVGTRYEGRSNAFASNFMPILEEKTEFAVKWSNLSTAHETEGIRDPIKAVEYMGKFYVEEGNKRVSVMKYFEAISIPGIVTRILPPRTNDKEVKIYYEFLDFYRLSQINYINFSREGSFAKLQALVGKGPEEAWTDDDQLTFSSVYTRFTAAYEANGGSKLSITPGDAFLAFLTVYGYEATDKTTAEELKKLVAKSWEEFRMLEDTDTIELKMHPTEKEKPLFKQLLPIGRPKQKIAFIYDKTPSSSAWVYAHELGRLHLEQTFTSEVTTVTYENVAIEGIDTVIEQAIKSGCTIIFTCTPSFASASAKAAIVHPDIKILNCSLNTSHRYIRTYYARLHEAKFLMGAIAGSMAENNRLTYIADYPVFGNIANINAFALGAKFVNPRAKVFLEWSTLKGVDLDANIQRVDPAIISGKDMVIPEDASRFFGIYHMDDGRSRRLAMPLCHWGKFYEKLIRTIMDGTWKYDDTSSKAINYWWGISSGVVDVICSQNLPAGTQRLVNLLKKTIASGEFEPFSGILYSQSGMIIGEPDHTLTPEEIVKMDWLAENIVGFIPTPEELLDNAQPMLSQQGIQNIID